MLYINIDKTVKIGDSLYSVTYLDYPKHTFIKRISKIINNLEEGIDFSNSLFFYSNGEKISDIDFDLSKALISDFVSNNVIESIKDKTTSLEEKTIIDRLFEEVYDLVIKKT